MRLSESLYSLVYLFLYLFMYIQTLEMLEKKERVLQKKISQEIERAKEYTRLKNKRGYLLIILRYFLLIWSFIPQGYWLWDDMFCIVCFIYYMPAAIQCLKKKKLYESQVEQLGKFQLRIHDQVKFVIILSHHLI